MTGTGSAPASSANLGPGFDCLALALTLRCTAEVAPAEQWDITSDAGDVDDIIRSAAGPGPFQITVTSEIPVGRGLGSSAAVAAAVAAAARRAQGEGDDPDRLFETVSAIEGHPDNAGAAVYGGLIAAGSEGVRSLPIAPQLIPVIAVPDTMLSTAAARRALPAEVPHEAATRQARRAVFLVEALRTAEPAAFAAARGEELHEPYRAGLSPITGALVEAALAAGALHAAWSGAGPSALALATSETAEAVADAMAGVLEGGGQVVQPEVDTSGVS